MTCWPRCTSCKTTGKTFWVEHNTDGPSCIESCTGSLGYYQINSTHCGRCGELSQADCESKGCQWSPQQFGSSRPASCIQSSTSANSAATVRGTWVALPVLLAAIGLPCLPYESRL